MKLDFYHLTKHYHLRLKCFKYLLNISNYQVQYCTRVLETSRCFMIFANLKIAAALSQGSSRVSSQFLHRDGSLNQQQEVNISQELNCLPLQQKQTLDGNPQQQTKQNNSLHVSETVSMQNSENKLRHVQEPKDLDSESQYPVLQKTGDQVVVTTGQATKTTGQCMSFALLIPIIEPQLDKDKAMHMRTLYNKLRVGLVHYYAISTQLFFYEWTICITCLPIS